MKKVGSALQNRHALLGGLRTYLPQQHSLLLRLLLGCLVPHARQVELAVALMLELMLNGQIGPGSSFEMASSLLTPTQP